MDIKISCIKCLGVLFYFEPHGYESAELLWFFWYTSQIYEWHENFCKILPEFIFSLILLRQNEVVKTHKVNVFAVICTPSFLKKQWELYNCLIELY